MYISRRRFLLQLTVLSGTSLLPGISAWADLSPSWVAVGSTENFAKDTWKRIVLPAKQHKAVIYIHHATDESFTALSAHCTHKGCEVDWDHEETEFICPCHNGRFDSKGQRTGGPPRKPLPSYPTKIDTNGQLFVQV